MNLTSGRNYVGVAVGDPTASTADERFAVSMLDGARTKGTNRQSVDVLVFHGSPDTPQTDVQVENGAVLANDTAFRQYGNRGRYTSVPARDLDIEVMLSNGTTEVREFDANLKGKGGSAMVLVETGRMDGSGSSGEVGLLAVSPNGTTQLLRTNPATFEGSEDNDVFVYTSQQEGIMQVFDSRTGQIQEFLTATNDSIAIDAKG